MKKKKALVPFVEELLAAFAVFAGTTEAQAQKPPLLPEKEVAALANELSGETAKRNLEAIAQFHRQRGSQGFHAAAELVAERLRAYGLSDVAILQFPADGKIFYGTQRSRPKLHTRKERLDPGYSASMCWRIMRPSLLCWRKTAKARTFLAQN